MDRAIRGASVGQGLLERIPEQKGLGKQVYLGAHDDEEAAAHAYDLAALKYWGHETILNFPLSTYQEELEQMERQSREEFIGALRRKSSGFSRGVSKYRGVARHHHNGRWEARLGRVLGNKYMYLGTYATQEEAAIAYDMAAIEYRGLNAVTNFNLSRYTGSSCGDQIVDAAATSMSSNDSSMDDLGFSFQLQDQQHFTEAISQLPVANYVSSSACELLLQPLKFQEMSERTSAASSSSLSFSPPSICGSIPSGCSFRDDLQTYFECHDGGNFTEEEDSIFGGLNALMSPLFKYELGTRGHLSYTHG